MSRTRLIFKIQFCPQDIDILKEAKKELELINHELRSNATHKDCILASRVYQAALRIYEILEETKNSESIFNAFNLKLVLCKLELIMSEYTIDMSETDFDHLATIEKIYKQLKSIFNELTEQI